MQISYIESVIYQISHIFLWPVLILILSAVVFALLSLGSFLMESVLRGRTTYQSAFARYLSQQKNPVSSDDLELWIVKKLEWLRIVSRTAPMLGLIATMIPMGPALLALSSGQTDQVGQNMVMAFSSVILSLVAASITFFILVIRRRWLLEELRQFERGQKYKEQADALS
ncbi:MotA/TolQ/ExbB proton channel family protein [Acinetobacter sp. S40]|uniref:MotA/TolQ/ExbB proton channel family protein n=1 Tax=Acinetobacter sp. S40 TaxID=2767434 RepID=UPI001D0E42BD|nr:MotA/TolQ/ExbB proton channel family protein [Acinetobacter sp. S40]